MDHLTTKTMVYYGDVVNYYPTCGMEMCLKLLGLLDFVDQNFQDKQCILDANDQ